MSHSLTLLVPGLPRPERGTLARVLARADMDHMDVHGVVATVARLAGIAGGLPAGALTAHAVGEGIRGQAMMRVDPVHLVADPDGLRLLPAAVLDITADESDTLAAHLKVHAGLDLVRADAWHWSCTQAGAGAALAPLDEAVGRHIGALMPDGDSRIEFRRWMNELQMIMHDSTVNRRRLDAGRLTINSLWPWGAGALPDHAAWPFRHAYASDPLVSGIATLAGADSGAVPGSFDELPAEGDSFVWLDEIELSIKLGDVEGRTTAETALSQHWVVPACTALADGRLDELVLLDGRGGRWRMRQWMRWRFWRA